MGNRANIVGGGDKFRLPVGTVTVPSISTDSSPLPTTGTAESEAESVAICERRFTGILRTLHCEMEHYLSNPAEHQQSLERISNLTWAAEAAGYLELARDRLVEARSDV